MKAIIYRDYGPPEVLRCVEIEKPGPREHEVLIRVRAASANPIDWHFMRGEPRILRLGAGLGRPRNPRLGFDVAGEVESIGPNVTRFKPGDEVFGACRGAFAEYVCVSERTLVAKPAEVSFEQAAAVPVAALTALQGLRDKGRIRPGQSVLINGASGGVGTFAVQIAKSFGADVTGVCSTRNVELVRSLGADRVVDYTRDDFTRGPRRYDVILDCVGNHPFSARRRVLTPDGVCVMVGGPNEGRWLGPMAGLLKAALLSRFMRQKFVMILAQVGKNRDLALLCDFLRTGQVTPVVDRCYPLTAAAEAIRYLETGRVRGKLVVTIANDRPA
jgi:NADPH:quinone reductase-like Zn-dependent oxidoreductase